ncbi:hypothetical protein K1T71_003838 [Dendrolimus kikuchii]|uniref:Uncharacterized protein n=1 Tax=Dendrolimus kikuchii TaxID=765133 RepID=A0ACC1D942_9NEOP|nr:hypothetical protein K1T71_003838 [Dendrolimus kikuchii]
MARNLQCVVFNILVTNQPAVCSVRLYGRWMHRKPAKVLLPFEPTGPVNLKEEKVIDLGTEILNKSRTKPGSHQTHKNNVDSSPPSTFSAEKSLEIKNKREDKIKKHKFYLNQQKVFNEQGEVIYEKLKENDTRISSLFVKLKSKKERSKSGLTLVEGWRMIVDGLEAKCSLKFVIFSQVEDLNNLRPFLPKTGVMFYKIPYREIEMWSNVETPPGIFGVFEIPSFEKIKRQFKPLPLHLICDNIRVPGNLGAILRAAVGVGCEKILLTKARLPSFFSIYYFDINLGLSSLISNIVSSRHNSLSVCGTLGIEISQFVGKLPRGKNIIFVFAASRNGLRLKIPLDNGVESLNTGMATAVIAFEIKKQLIQAWAKASLERKMGVLP